MALILLEPSSLALRGSPVLLPEARFGGMPPQRCPLRAPDGTAVASR